MGVLRKSLLLVALGATAFASLPANAQYPFPKGSTLSSSGPVRACGTTVFSGGGYKPFSTVTVSRDGKVVGKAQANADGNFFLQVDIPCDLTGKSISFTAVGVDPSGAPRTMTFETNVLAATGANSLSLVYLALGLVLAGGVLFALGKRRAVARA